MKIALSTARPPPLPELDAAEALAAAGHRIVPLSARWDVLHHEGAAGLARSSALARVSGRRLVAVLADGEAPGRLGSRALRGATLVCVGSPAAARALAAQAGLVPEPVALIGAPGPSDRLAAAYERCPALPRGGRPRRLRRPPGWPAVLVRLAGARAPRLPATLTRIGRHGAAARLALAAGDEAAAGRHSELAVGSSSGRRAGLAVRATLLERAGEPTTALEAARAAGDTAAARRLEGLQRTLDPGATGRPPLRRALGRGPRVLVLLESSLPQAPAGYALRSAALLRAFGRQGLQPVVATRMGFPAARGREDFAAVEWVEGIPHHRLWLPGVRHYTAVALDEQLDRALRELAPLGDRIAPALIWAATPQLNALAGIALRDRLGVPLVYDVRGFPELSWEAEHGGAAELSRARAAAETAAMAAADQVVTLGEVMRTRIVARGVDPRRVSVLGHVVDADTPSPTGAGAAEGAPKVGLATTLRRYEGVEVFLRAVADLRAGGAELEPLVLGDGPQLQSLRRLAAELRLPPAALPGRVPAGEAARRVGELAAVVVPRLDEEVCRWVVPLKPLEALAAGRPLIASDLPALRELAGEGRARLVAPGDPAALAAAIAADVDDPAGARERAALARRWALAEHGPAALDRALRALLDGLGG